MFCKDFFEKNSFFGFFLISFLFNKEGRIKWIKFFGFGFTSNFFPSFNWRKKERENNFWIKIKSFELWFSFFFKFIFSVGSCEEWFFFCEKFLFSSKFNIFFSNFFFFMINVSKKIKKNSYFDEMKKHFWIKKLQRLRKLKKTLF